MKPRLKEIKLKIDPTRLHGGAKDGQISVKLSKSDEIRFKMLKAKHDRYLNELARSLILNLINELEAQDVAS